MSIRATSAVAATIVSAAFALGGCGSSTPTTASSTASSSSVPTQTGSKPKKSTTPQPAAAPYQPPKGAAPDPYRSRQYGLDEIHLPQAWKKSAGQGVVIAIVDSGVDLQHPDLKSRLVPGHDFVTSGGNAEDKNGHGTHVAGIAAAATENGVGISGGAPDAKIMPVRVLDQNGQGSTSNINAGIEWAADHGAKVINLSLGESGLAGRLLRGGSLNSAIAHAVRKGAVVVAAAGNDGGANKPYRATTPVLIVGAVDSNGQPAKFSNFGAEDAVTAPGVQVFSTLPTYSTEQSDMHGKGYGYLDGTSMAAPFVSAVAALLVAQGRTPQQVINAIEATAQNPNHLTRLGLGIANAQAAVDSPFDIRPPTPSTNGGSTSPPASTSTQPQARSHRGGHRKT
jgi:subtilisin family serine protease